MSTIVLACTASAAVLYASGSLQIKRALSYGAENRRANAETNIAMALWSLPLFFVARGDFEWTSWLTAVCAGVALFVG